MIDMMIGKIIIMIGIEIIIIGIPTNNDKQIIIMIATNNNDKKIIIMIGSSLRLDTLALESRDPLLRPCIMIGKIKK